MSSLNIEDVNLHFAVDGNLIDIYSLHPSDPAFLFPLVIDVEHIHLLVHLDEHFLLLLVLGEVEQLA